MNITFDLETLGNGSTAPITQIGAVKFTNKGEITDKFLATVNIEDLQQYNFSVDYSIIGWWLNQSNEAIKSVYGDDIIKVSLDHALYKFKVWLGAPSDYKYWSHTTFDPPILEYNYRQVKKPNPISFRLHRDIRTLTDLFGPVTVKRKGIHHNALDDAIYQSEYISALLQKQK